MPNIKIDVTAGRIEAHFTLRGRSTVLHMSHGRHMWNLLRNDTQGEEQNSLFTLAVTVEGAGQMLKDVATHIIASGQTTTPDVRGRKFGTQGVNTFWYWHPLRGLETELHAFPVSGDRVVQLTKAQFLAIRAVKCHLHRDVGPDLHRSITEAGGWNTVWRLLKSVSPCLIERQVKSTLNIAA